MQDEKVHHWVVTAGFATLVVILVLEGLAVYRLNTGSTHFQAPMIEWSETIMRALFGKTR